MIPRKGRFRALAFLPPQMGRSRSTLQYLGIKCWRELQGKLQMNRSVASPVLRALVAGFLVLLSAPAQASAFGCTYQTERSASSCVRIWGERTYVDNAAAGVMVGARTKARGFVKLTVDGRLIKKSGMYTCSNSAFDKTKYCEIGKWYFKQHWRNGATVCGQFIFDDGRALTRACKVIKQ